MKFNIHPELATNEANEKRIKVTLTARRTRPEGGKFEEQRTVIESPAITAEVTFDFALSQVNHAVNYVLRKGNHEIGTGQAVPDAIDSSGQRVELSPEDQKLWNQVFIHSELPDVRFSGNPEDFAWVNDKLRFVGEIPADFTSCEVFEPVYHSPSRNREA